MLAMSDRSPDTVFGCLLDVSGSMREALETGRSDEHTIERLRAVLRAALKLAQAELRRDPQALAFVGVFGLYVDTKCPPVVDLCGIVKALLGGYQDHRTGHELLIALANQNNLAHITKYIRTKLSDDQARIVYVHLRLHPDRVAEFVDAIPAEERLQNFRNKSRGAGATIGAVLGTMVLGPPGAFIGGSIGSIAGNEGAAYAEDNAVDRSDALQLARCICDEWLLDFSNLEPRPVADVVDLLQQLQDHPAAGGGDQGLGPDKRTVLDTLREYMYGNTPMRDTLTESLAVFRKYPIVKQRVLVLVSDGESTDGNPLPIACELQKEKVILAAVYLTSDPAMPRRRLYDRPAEDWNAGQRTLFSMAARVDCAEHPIPVLASIGWEVPSSAECGLYTIACSSAVLDEFCSILLSARFGSADALLDVVGRVQLDAYISQKHVRSARKPSNQRRSPTCYAHATAAVIHMALLRIVGLDAGYPMIKDIRRKIVRQFRPNQGGWDMEEMLRMATTWYRPLQFRKVDEDGARQAVLHRRPVLTTFYLSESGWDTFTQHFESVATSSSVLMRDHMTSHRLLPDDGGHAVVLFKCDPHSLTFLNSWGKEWGNKGSFSIEDHTVLELDDASEATSVCFYDVYWLEEDLTAIEQQAYNLKVDEELHARAEKYPSILELEARCPHCHVNSPIADFTGSIREAVCPRCHKSFAPQPGHLVQALYARAGLNDAE
ncbi:hypothetical protein BKA65DRAFT_458517 [Rhexocercosporidium sp. MPI-PUGE-AT-0058]|nr:hypothetical protein BKA65DRAFT_458517 [Rhexocercosporidium sp. MPI-PUGE-AT-0058]